MKIEEGTGLSLHFSDLLFLGYETPLCSFRFEEYVLGFHVTFGVRLLIVQDSSLNIERSHFAMETLVDGFQDCSFYSRCIWLVLT
jgi:hypothetical protein